MAILFRTQPLAFGNKQWILTIKLMKEKRIDYFGLGPESRLHLRRRDVHVSERWLSKWTLLQVSRR